MKINRSSTYIAISLVCSLLASIFLYDRIVAYKELVQLGRINVQTSSLSSLQKKISLDNIKHTANLIQIQETISVVVVLITVLIIFKQLSKMKLK